MIKERTTAGLHAERPAKRMLNHTLLVVLGLHCGLDADAEFLRLAVLREIVLRNRLLGERAAHSLAEERVFADEFLPRAKFGPGTPILLDAHVADGDADDGTLRRGRAKTMQLP